MFERLRHLVTQLKEQNWLLHIFNFRFNHINYYVIIHRYTEGEYRPQYALTKLIFIDQQNEQRTFIAHINTRDFIALDTREFFQFFRIPYIPNGLGNVMEEFKNQLAESIPENFINSTEEQNIAIARYIDNQRNRNTGVYLRNLIRLGLDRYGKQKYRSYFTDEKARRLRPDVYQYIANDRTITFRFSNHQEENNTLEEIIRLFNN